MTPPEGAIETTNGYVWLEDGIVFVRSKNRLGNPETFKESIAAITSLVGDTPRPTLWDAREWLGASPTAWGQLVSVIGSLVTAAAMVVRPDSQVVGPFPEAIDRLIVPYKVFTTTEAALGFLRPFAARAGG